MQTIPVRPTVGNILDSYLELLRQRVADGVRSPATLEMTEAHARWWRQQLGAELAAIDVTGPALEAVAARRTTGPETLRKRMSTLRGVLKLAHRRGLIAAVPAIPQLPVPFTTRGRYLRNYDQARALFEALPRHRAEWFWLCLWTAQHKSDVDRMTWADCDPFDSVPWILIRNWKNRRREGLRVVCPVPLAEVLREMHARDRPSLTAKVVRPWPSPSHTLHAYCRRLGLPELAPIDLRHTCLSWAAAEHGITPAFLAFAGHGSPTMAARRYAHALKPQLADLTTAIVRASRPPRGGGQDPDGGGDPT